MGILRICKLFNRRNRHGDHPVLKGTYLNRTAPRQHQAHLHGLHKVLVSQGMRDISENCTKGFAGNNVCQLQQMRTVRLIGYRRPSHEHPTIHAHPVLAAL